MKSVLLVVCALAYGLAPSVVAFQNLAVMVLFAISLGLIYFVFYRHDWPPPLVPWLFACVAVARVAAYWCLNSRHGRVGALADAEVWFFGGLAALSFAFAWWKRINGHSETPVSTNPKSM